MASILKCMDRWGREIELDEYVWVWKIVRGGTRLPEDSLDAVRQALSTPQFVMHDKTHEDGECFYAANVLPGRLAHLYLKVCVKIESEEDGNRETGRVITAYPTDRVPKGERQKWP